MFAKAFAGAVGCLRPLAAETTGELEVLRLDCNTLGVDSGEVSVLEERHKVGLGCLLKGADGRRLETQVRLEVLGNLTDETLERELADEQLGGLLVLPDLTKSDGPRPVPVGLLHTTSGDGGCMLAGSLGGELFPGGLATGGLAGGLLGTSHDDIVV